MGVVPDLPTWIDADRGGSRNSLKGGGGGFWARILRRGGVRVQVRGNY